MPSDNEVERPAFAAGAGETASPARALPDLFAEASELAYYGAKVIHPATIHPALEGGIPVRILNTFDPAAPGRAPLQYTCTRSLGHRGQIDAGGPFH